MTTYYPLTQRGEFADVESLCEQTGIDRHLAESYVLEGRHTGSELIVCNRISLGDPELGMRAVLQLVGSGNVVLWLAMFYRSSQQIDHVQAFNRLAASQYGVAFSVGASDGESVTFA